MNRHSHKQTHTTKNDPTQRTSRTVNSRTEKNEPLNKTTNHALHMRINQEHNANTIHKTNQTNDP